MEEMHFNLWKFMINFFRISPMVRRMAKMQGLVWNEVYSKAAKSVLFLNFFPSVSRDGKMFSKKYESSHFAHSPFSWRSYASSSYTCELEMRYKWPKNGVKGWWCWQTLLLKACGLDSAANEYCTALWTVKRLGGEQFEVIKCTNTQMGKFKR